MTYKNWLNEWLEHYIKPVSKMRTYERYCGLSIHISKHLGNFEINELSPFILQKFITEISEKGNIKTGAPLSPNTVNAIITVLQNSLKTAFTIGLTDVYVGDKIKRPTVKKSD